MADIDKNGEFYLGREHDLASGKTSKEPLLYKSKDLTTHAVCVGMTGSGKTGLCLSLLEEAALDGVPAIAIDPKGDLGNLLLAFPEFKASDYRPWIDERAATRKGVTPQEFAQSRADLWKSGLAKWSQDGQRVKRYLDSVEHVIYTPGSNAGIPLTILKSFQAPPQEIQEDIEAFRDKIQSTVSGLLTLLGSDADPIQSREHIFLSNLLDQAWRAGRDLELSDMIREIQDPPFEKVGVMDLDTFFPATSRKKLAMRLNNLLASPSFASWMEGEPLDIQRLFYQGDGKPKLSIISIAHMNESERMFFVTLLLNEIVTWMRTQEGTSSLRALLYMDEVFGYFPPVANPPSKKPMLTILKQARAYGLGCVLATQNPVDLDYKGLSNTGTWFLGRLQTERDKARVLEGLEGASVSAGSTFSREKMEKMLAGLGSRVFMMHNVHNEQPVVFHTRWAMSFLRGPITRKQIKKLMDPKREKYRLEAEKHGGGTGAKKEKTPGASRPIVPKGIKETFVALDEHLPSGWRLEYRPGLLAKVKLHFVKSTYNKLDQWREITVLKPLYDGLLPDSIWSEAEVLTEELQSDQTPDERAGFLEISPELVREKNYKLFERKLKDHVYQTEEAVLWHCDALDAYSDLAEEEADFRERLELGAVKMAVAQKEKLQASYEIKIKRMEDRIRTAEGKVEEQKSQFFGKIMRIVMLGIEMAMAIFSGGKMGRGRTSSVASAGRQAMTERGQQGRAEEKLADLLEDKETLEAELSTKLEAVEKLCEVENLLLEPCTVSPRKSDISIERVQLAWLPWRIDPNGSADAAF